MGAGNGIAGPRWATRVLVRTLHHLAGKSMGRTCPRRRYDRRLRRAPLLQPLAACQARCRLFKILFSYHPKKTLELHVGSPSHCSLLTTSLAASGTLGCTLGQDDQLHLRAPPRVALEPVQDGHRDLLSLCTKVGKSNFAALPLLRKMTPFQTSSFFLSRP